MRRKARYQASPQQFTLPLDTVSLWRIDPSRNMARFYSMAVERDLFGQVVLVRRWGRINGAGRTRLDEYRGEGEAFAALTALETAKKRRGYKATDYHS
jgi:predicted DNA-binding WGR domain protein